MQHMPIKMFFLLFTGKLSVRTSFDNESNLKQGKLEGDYYWMYCVICRWIDRSVNRGLTSSSSGKLSQSHSVHFQTGDTDEGPALKKNHREESTSESNKTDLPAHNSIADTLLCSICQVWRKGWKTELHSALLFNKSTVKIQSHFYYSVHTF